MFSTSIWLFTEREALMEAGEPKIEVTHHDGVVQVELLYEEILEEAVISVITESIVNLVDDNPGLNLLISFKNVKHFSSSALGMLIRIHKHVEEVNGKLRLCEITPSLYEIFMITKLNKLFKIFEEQDQAIKSFAR